MFYHLINVGMSNIGYLAREVRQSNTCPLRKPGFPIIFAKNSPTKNTHKPKISLPVKYNVANALNGEQTDARESSDSRNAVGNGECQRCFENEKLSALFLTKTDRKKICWKL